MIQGPQRATMDDFDSILKLVDECFHAEGGMLAAWPHCYIPKAEKIRNCLIMKDDDTVVSLVEYVDQTVIVEDSEMRVAGITAVSTWPTYRERGFMTGLLKHCISLMIEEGYAFSDLGGDRRRYGRHGWENAGRQWNFSIRRRSFQAVDSPGDVEVVPYEASAQEIDAIAAIHALEPLRMKRTHDLHKVLLGRMGKQVWLARGSDGIVAYVISQPAGKDQNVAEFGGSAEGVRGILAHLMRNLEGDAIHFHAPWSHPLNPMLCSISSGWTLGCLRMIKIIDLEATLRAFAHHLWRKYSDLGIKDHRTIALGIEGTDQQVEISFGPEEVSLKKVSDPTNALILSEHQMVRLIFGPGSPSTTINLPQNARFLDAILPVAFYLTRNEAV